jgi:hypothetical protein
MTTILKSLAECLAVRSGLPEMTTVEAEFMATSAVEFLQAQGSQLFNKFLDNLEEGDVQAFGHVLRLILEERP